MSMTQLKRAGAIVADAHKTLTTRTSPKIPYHIVATDGSVLRTSRHGDRRGGWAFFCVANGVYGMGGEASNSTNRMELMAVTTAVSRLRGNVLIVTDSMYVLDGVRKIQEGQTWFMRDNAHRDLWKIIRDNAGRIRLTWVKSHSGHSENDVADKLAGAAARMIQDTDAPWSCTVKWNDAKRRFEAYDEV